MHSRMWAAAETLQSSFNSLSVSDSYAKQGQRITIVARLQHHDGIVRCIPAVTHEDVSEKHVGANSYPRILWRERVRAPSM
jgi:hypothetical protein